MGVKLEEAAGAAKAQTHANQAYALQNGQLATTRMQQQIPAPMGLGAPGQVVRGPRKEKTSDLRLSFSPDLSATSCRRHKKAPPIPLRERVVMKSYLPDTLKMECLDRLDRIQNREDQRKQPAVLDPPPEVDEEISKDLPLEGMSEVPEPHRMGLLPGGFRAGQEIVARMDLMSGEELLVKYLDQGKVLGPSRGNDPTQVCVSWEEPLSPGMAWMNVLPAEIMSAENGKLMQLNPKPPGVSPKAKPKPKAQEVPVPEEYAEAEPMEFSSRSSDPSVPWTCHLARGTSMREARDEAPEPGRIQKALTISNSLPSLLKR